MSTSSYGAFSPIPDAMRSYTQGLLPLRIVRYGSKLGEELQKGAGWVESMLGMPQAPPAGDDAWHDQMVRQALHSAGARAEDEPVQQAKPPMRRPVVRGQ
jgi:hypothetical protein